MDIGGIPYLSLVDLAEKIRTKEVSPVEVAEAYLMRIERINPMVNAYITIMAEEALESAKKAEADIVRGEYLGPMHGVPVALKDQLWTKGVLTTNGSTVLGNFVPDEDATVVTNLKASGAVIMGKLNMMEFAGGGIFKFPYGIPRNPWNLEHQTGGSSTGSGAATAAFLCTTSLGEDTGGSIRSPSAMCGLVGLRPTWGRVSRYGLFSATWSMDTPGPMSRTAEDCAITLGAIAGHDTKDPYTRNVPVPDYRGALTGDLRGTKVGIVREIANDDSVQPWVKDAVMAAAEKLRELGATVEEVSIPLAQNRHSYLIQIPLTTVEMAAIYSGLMRDRLEEFNYDIQIRLLLGKTMPARFYYQAQRLREVLREQVREALNSYDVLIAPTDTSPAPRIEPGKMPTSKQEVIDGILRPIFCTVSFALAGVPVLSVPCGFAEVDGGELPIGLQMAGRPFEEGTILNAAYCYEQSTPWHTRRPSI